jgi:hypothetical protein
VEPKLAKILEEFLLKCQFDPHPPKEPKFRNPKKFIEKRIL